MELQWPLILFTTLTAWGCGVLGGAGALALKGAGKKSQQLLAILSCVLLAVGGICVFFHLQHWERIFNGFGHITSGITQELILQPRLEMNLAAQSSSEIGVGAGLSSAEMGLRLRYDIARESIPDRDCST